jgi:predicted nuclease with TOPRIM domain
MYPYSTTLKGVTPLKLYELTQSYQDILDLAESAEDNQYLYEALEALEDEFENKLENIGKVMQSLDADSEGIDYEIKRLQEKKKALKTNKDNLKRYVEREMLKLGKRKIKTRLFSFNIQNNAPSLDILDDRYIPKEFYTEQEPKLDKRSLLKSLKSGDVIKGVEIKQTEGLRIR